MSDQSRLPVSFPPGTELPITGKVEVTNEVHTLITNPELLVHVTNEVPVAVTNATLNVKPVAGSELGVTSVGKINSGTIDKVTKVDSGKIEVTNTVKVEGVATAQNITVSNGAEATQAKIAGGRLLTTIGSGEGEEQTSVKRKRLLVTEGYKREKLTATLTLNQVGWEFGESVNSLYVLESFFATHNHVESAEKTVYAFLARIADTSAGVNLFFYKAVIGERPGTGTATSVFTFSFIPNASRVETSFNKIGSNMEAFIMLPCPALHCGQGVKLIMEVKVFNGTTAEPFKEEKPKGTGGTAVFINNEGTL